MSGQELAERAIDQLAKPLGKARFRLTLKLPSPPDLPPVSTRVLAVCCYMPDRPNLIDELLSAAHEARLTRIDLVLSNNSSARPSDAARPFVEYTNPGMHKYEALAHILPERLRPEHEFVLLLDDDIRYPPAFFDRYLRVVKGLNLAVSQPALTRNSHHSHPSTLQLEDSIAHATPFVEIGPATCIARDVLPLIPFREAPPSGWGLDLVWSGVCLGRGDVLGVVDWTPVDHSFRPVGKGYDSVAAWEHTRQFVKRFPHVPHYAGEVVGQKLPSSRYPALAPAARTT